MSRDLEVITQLEPSLSGLAEAIESIRGLSVENTSGSVWDVSRGANRKHSFSVDLPVRVEREDLPPTVLPQIFDPAALVTFSATGTQGIDLDYARKAARAVAGRFNGVVYDPEADTVFPRRTFRQAHVPSKEDRETSLVEFTWTFPAAEVRAPLIERWLELCSVLVPEAMPRRYGDYEPLQGRWDQGGKEIFLGEWDLSRHLMFFSGQEPVEGGFVPTPGNNLPWASFGLTVFATAFDDDSWTRVFREFFIKFAESSHCLYAYAEVIRGVLWSGSRISFTGTTERTAQPATPDGWVGLLPYPVSWAWYGEPYRDLVRGRLEGGDVLEFEPGLYHQLTPVPVNRDALRSRLGVEPEWVPSTLRSRAQPNDGRPVALEEARAQTVPPELEG